MSAIREIAGPSPRALWIDADEVERAITKDEFFLEYEPTARVRAGYPARKLEARPFWRHPRWGLLSEAEFGQHADRAGLGATVSEWVLTTALRQTREWRRLGVDADVAVNLSPSDLHHRLAGTLAAVIEFSGSSPAAVTCEVPEDAIGRRPDLAASVFSELRWLGVRVAIEDFGRTLASFGWLASVRADEVKLPRELIADIQLSADHAARAVTAVAAAQTLGIAVVACGVADEHDLETARALGCDAAQGIAVCPPLDAEAAFAWLRSPVR